MEKKKKKKREENGRGPFEQWVCSEPRGGAIESNNSTRPRGGEEVISLGHLVAVCFIFTGCEN